MNLPSKTLWHLLPLIALSTAALALAVEEDQPATNGTGAEWIEEPPPPLPPLPPGETEVSSTPASSPPATQPSMEDFQRALDGSGQWANDADLGRVWVPAPEVVGNDFTPYVTGGAWAYTPAGWSFEGAWPWSWAVFHYGRWSLTPTYGWVWWPSFAWAPAWVEWRRSHGYMAWAALPPSGFRHPFALGVAGWGFAPLRHLGHADLPRHLVFPRGMPTTGGRTTWSWTHSPAPRTVTPQSTPHSGGAPHPAHHGGGGSRH